MVIQCINENKCKERHDVNAYFNCPPELKQIDLTNPKLHYITYVYLTCSRDHIRRLQILRSS